MTNVILEDSLFGRVYLRDLNINLRKSGLFSIIRGDDIVEKKNDAQLQTTFVTTLQVAAMCSG